MIANVRGGCKHPHMQYKNNYALLIFDTGGIKCSSFNCKFVLFILFLQKKKKKKKMPSI